MSTVIDDRDRHLGVVLAGWVMAFAFPIGGVVAGILLADRRPVHALGQIVVSSVATGVYVYLVGR